MICRGKAIFAQKASERSSVHNGPANIQDSSFAPGVYVPLGVLKKYLLRFLCEYSLTGVLFFHIVTPGLLLRMFMLLYDMEVVEEEAFVKWKEDVNDDHPGKGKALFQVKLKRMCKQEI